METRYDRQQLIPQWHQENLSKATVLLAGAGALGNEILKNLALLGIGKILVVDFDHIELSNLSRTVLFRETDLGKSKAAVAARAAMELNPEIVIKYLHGDLFFDIGMGFYRHTDLVISGLDNIAARSKVGQCAYLCGKPFIDSGIWGMGGEVRAFWPGEGFCYDCTLGDTEWQNAHLRRSCTGFKPMETTSAPPAPSNIATTSIIAGLVGQEVVRYLNKQPSMESGDALVFNGLRQSLHSSRLPGEDNCTCRFGKPLTSIVSLDLGVATTTAREFWNIALGALGTVERVELGRDLLVGYEEDECVHADCPYRQHPFEPMLMARIQEAILECNRCGRMRRPKIASSYDADFLYPDHTLKKLGVPAGEILAAWNREEVCYFEFSKDVFDYWT